MSVESRNLETGRSVVVGVTSKQPEVVVRTAARLARALHSDLVCAHVDPLAYVVAENPDGSVESRPVDPDGQGWSDQPFNPALADRLMAIASEEGVSLQLRQLAGDVARAIGRLADVIDAALIVVGSRSGVRATMREYFGGSVAVHLAHRQHRPVVIVPLAVRAEGPLPWEQA